MLVGGFCAVAVQDTSRRLKISAIGISFAVLIMNLVQALALYYGSTLLELGMYVRRRLVFCSGSLLLVDEIFKSFFA